MAGNDNKHIGCISGLLQIFDRQQMLAGKRVHSSKRLPHSTVVGGPLETVSSESQTDSCQSSPSANVNAGPISKPAKSPVFELKHGAQKIARHSLDSKATIASNGSIGQKDICKEGSVSSLSECVSIDTSVADGDDKQRLRAPSVVARLMGLESLSSPDQNNLPPQALKPGLQRSASESRASSRDVFRSKYIDDNNFQVKTPGNQLQKQNIASIVASEVSSVRRYRDCVDTMKNLNPESCKTSHWRSPRSFFDTTDVFPEQSQTHMAMQVDFEKKLKMIRRMDEHSNDLGTLKQILEVFQLKGLLHNSNRPSKTPDTHHSLVHNESSIVVMKPWRVPSSKVDTKRYGNEPRGANGSRSPVRARSSSPARVESNLKNCNSIVKRKPLSIEIQRRTGDSINSLKTSPTDSPKLAPKRANKSPRSHNSPKQTSPKNVVTNEKPNINAQNIVATPPSATLKGAKWDGCIEGKSLLQRCDKLLHNIAEMNKNSESTESPPSSAPVLPSPVSVLESGFDKDEFLAASPLHNIEFKATSSDEFDESLSLSTKLTEHEEFISDDSDFVYISEILGETQDLKEDSSIFLMIEKRLYNTSNTSNVSKRHRKLVFDIIVEMLDRNSELPPWKASSMPLIKHIWSEFQKIREINIKASDVLVDLINGVLKKDLIEISEWGDHPIETSKAILDVERMIFKDLVCEAIRDFGEFSSKCRFLRSQKKLVF